MTRGAVFSLAIPFDAKGPQANHPRRFNPIHRMTLTGPDCTTGAVKFPGGVGFSDDMVIMPLQCATQLVALSHCSLYGQLYNGYDANEVSSRGAKRLGIEKVARGVAARGVLVDLPRAHGVGWLEPGYAITAEDLDAALAAERVEIHSGDGGRTRVTLQPATSRYLIARGLIGDPTAPVIGNGGAAKKNS